MNQIYPDAAAALEGVLTEGMLGAAGGFGLGIPVLVSNYIPDLITAGKQTITEMRAATEATLV